MAYVYISKSLDKQWCIIVIQNHCCSKTLAKIIWHTPILFLTVPLSHNALKGESEAYARPSRRVRFSGTTREKIRREKAFFQSLFDYLMKFKNNRISIIATD